MLCILKHTLSFPDLVKCFVMVLYNACTNVDSSVCRDHVLPISLFTVSTQQLSYLVYLFNPNGENILLHKARVE